MLRVVVVGAGAIGGPIAAHMAENHVDITLVTKHPDLAETIKTRGLQLKGLEKFRSVLIKAVPFIEDLEGNFEIIFLATKGTDVEAAAKAIVPFLHEDGVVVTLQNGIVEDAIGDIVGRSRIIGSVVKWGSTMLEPALIEITSSGDFYIGLIDETGNKQKIQDVSKLLEYSAPVNVTDNIYGALYSKLAINACLTTLGAICGLYLGEMLASRRTRRLFMGITTEVVKVAEKSGVHMEKILPLHSRSLILTGSDSRLSLLKKHLLIKIVGWKYRKVKSSSLQSLERGKKSEIDFLNGYIVQKGEETGIMTPINSECVRLIKEIEAGKREIHPDNLLELPIP